MTSESDQFPKKRKAPSTAWKKGKPKTGGRKKGVQNKLTVQTKEFIQKLIDENQGLVSEQFQKALKKSPVGTLPIFVNLLEFVIPKLSRTEMTGKDGESIRIEVRTADEAGKEALMKLASGNVRTDDDQEGSKKEGSEDE